MNTIVFVGCNALGDTLCTTPVVAAVRRANPSAFLVYVTHNAAYCRVLDGHPDLDLVVYNEHLWVHGTPAITEDWLRSLPLPLDEPAAVYHFDMDAVVDQTAGFAGHIAHGFSRLLGVPIDSVRPRIRLGDDERTTARRLAARPYVVFASHSNANPRDAAGVGAKDWPLERWARLAEHLRTRWRLDVLALGAERDPFMPLPHVRNLHGLPIKVVAALLESARCVVTLENGLAHLAAAVDAPMVELYAPIVPLVWARPAEATCATVLYEAPWSIAFERVVAAVEPILARRPPARRRVPLNDRLDSLVGPLNI